MLDAYASTGMPLFYKHWSFGKHFVQHQAVYQKGLRGLAYEIVINSNPCISYIIEENTATMQTLVISHAAFGHNHFFKNNYLFRVWTDAEGILPYLSSLRAMSRHARSAMGSRRWNACWMRPMRSGAMDSPISAQEEPGPRVGGAARARTPP